MEGLWVSTEDTSPSLAAIVSGVDFELPEQRARTSPDGMLTIAFTDIEGSTELLERVGELRWLALIREHNQIVRDCVAEHDGDVVKSQGDGFMVVFTSASAALSFAVELQRSLARRNQIDPEQQLRVRVGMHTGNVFQAEEDFLGRAVVLAARIAGRARGGEILISSASHEYTSRTGRWRYGATEELRLKGMGKVERVYSLDWGP